MLPRPPGVPLHPILLLYDVTPSFACARQDFQDERGDSAAAGGFRARAFVLQRRSSIGSAPRSPRCCWLRVERVESVESADGVWVWCVSGGVSKQKCCWS